MSHNQFNIKIIHLAFFLTVLSLLNPARAQDSILLDDTIKQGLGNIDLLDGKGRLQISSNEIENIRLANNGKIIFGVDINEAASGTEKAATQGVAISNVVLSATIFGNTYTFSDFTTETQSSLAQSGSENRQSYYTLIGRTGSNNITGSELHGTSFDSTLSIAVDMELNMATALNLHIELLDTNTDLGDPEEFYDYTAGFEDIAILAPTDVEFLNNQAAGRNEAPLVVLTNTPTQVSSHIYFPASDTYYLVGYEDNFPSKGDYDFNDLVVAYRVSYGLDSQGKIKTINGEGFLVARGGAYSHDWHLRIPLPSHSRATGTFELYQPLNPDPLVNYTADLDVTNGLDFTIYSDTAVLFVDPNTPFANTLWYANHIQGHKFEFSVSLENTVVLNQMNNAPFDPYLYVRNTQYEIHLQDQASVMPNSLNTIYNIDNFTDENGLPFAMILPEEWCFPNEYVDISNAYPTFTDYILSQRQQHKDWYNNKVSSGVTRFTKENWKWNR